MNTGNRKIYLGVFNPNLLKIVKYVLDKSYSKYKNMAWVYTQKTTLNIISLFWLKTTDLMSSSCNMRHFFYSWRYYEKLCWQSLSKCYNRCTISNNRSRHPEVFLGKGVLKICSKFTGEHPCRSAIVKQLYWNRTSAWVFCCKFAAYFQNTFFRNSSGWLLLK